MFVNMILRAFKSSQKSKEKQKEKSGDVDASADADADADDEDAAPTEVAVVGKKRKERWVLRLVERGTEINAKPLPPLV